MSTKEPHTTDPRNAGKDNLGSQKQYAVFFVEDDVDDQTLVLKTLEPSPYIHEIHCFTSGEQLIGHIAMKGYYCGGLIPTLPTLILLDLHIAGENGLSVLQELKDHPLTANIPVVIVTNDSSRERAAEAFRLKADGYIAKPLQLEHIHQIMKTKLPWPLKKLNYNNEKTSPLKQQETEK